MRNLEVKNKKERSILLRWDALFGKKTQASTGTEKKNKGNTFVSLLQNYLKDGGKGDAFCI